MQQFSPIEIQQPVTLSSAYSFKLLNAAYSGCIEERRLRAILLVDTLNFCFWPCCDWEYDRFEAHARTFLCCISGFLAGLRLPFETLLSNLTTRDVAPTLWTLYGQPCLSALLPFTDVAGCRWSTLSEGELAEVLGGQLPEMQERTRLVREVGVSISSTWGCLVTNMIVAAGGSACKLVDLVTSSFAGFRDACIYRFICVSLR